MFKMLFKNKNEQDQKDKENEKQKFKEFDLLQKSIDKSTNGFFHSTPLITYQENGNSFEVDLRKFFLISALSEGNVLLRGGTGIGKTSFAKAFLEGLFNQNYGVIQFDIGLDETKYLDVDFGKMKKGQNLSDAITESKLIKMPAIIFDEYNRALGAQTSLVQGWLINDELTIEGNKKIRPGYKLKDSNHYQLKIATINEGNEYINTQEIDFASRDRFSIELNLDNFPMNDIDKNNLILNSCFVNKNNYENKSLIETENSNLKSFFDLYFKIKDIQLSAQAQEFLVYLQRLDNCYKSPIGTKKSFIEFNSHSICEGCHALNKDNGICSSIHAISPRTASNLIKLGKAFAAYRIYKLANENKETSNEMAINDLEAVAPFVLSMQKLDLSKEWIQKSVNQTGNSEYAAVKEAFNIIKQRFNNDKLVSINPILDENKNQDPAENEKQKINQIMKNPWSSSRENVIKVYEYLRKTGNFFNKT